MVKPAQNEKEKEAEWKEDTRTSAGFQGKGVAKRMAGGGGQISRWGGELPNLPLPTAVSLATCSFPTAQLCLNTTSHVC